MKNILKLLLPLLLLLLCVPSKLQASIKYQSWCQQGGATVTTAGITSTTFVQRSYRTCTVTVYAAGTLTLATIYSDSSGTPLSNPFTNQNTSTGQYYFYIDEGNYDIKFAATGLTTFTLGDVPVGLPNPVSVNCANSAGATMSAKVASCIAALPSSGGIADARGIHGAQSWNSDPCTGVTKPVTLLLSGVTMTLSATVSCGSSVNIWADNGAIFSIPTSASLPTLTLCQFDGTLTQHFSYVSTTTSRISFEPSGCAIPRTFYPEWWGAKADSALPPSASSGTDNMLPFRYMSRAVPARSVIRLSGGAYYGSRPPNLGSTSACTERNGNGGSGLTFCLGTLSILKDGIQIIGAGKGSTYMRFTSASWSQSDSSLGRPSPLIYVNGIYASNGPCTSFGVAVSCVIQGTTLRDFTVEDMNPLGQAFFAGVDYQGTSAILIGPSSNTEVINVEGLNTSGNSFIQVFGECPEAAYRTQPCTDQGYGLLISNTWLHSDGRPWNVSVTTPTGTYGAGNQYYCGFAPYNTGGIEDQRMLNNRVECDWSTGGSDSNYGSTARLGKNFIWSNNYFDGLNIQPQMYASGGAHKCISVGYGQYIQIINNTCTGFAGTTTPINGIVFSSEVIVGKYSGYQYVNISGNKIIMDTTPAVGSNNICLDANIGLTVGIGQVFDDIEISNNWCSSQTAMIFPVKKIQRINIHDNTFNWGQSDAGGIFVNADFNCNSLADVQANLYLTLHDNKIIRTTTSNPPKLFGFNNYPCFQSNPLVKFWNNTFAPLINVASTPWAGVPWQINPNVTLAPGAITISTIGTTGASAVTAITLNGTYGLSDTTTSYTGAIAGDRYTILGMGTGTAITAGLPNGLIVTVSTTTDNRFGIYIVNNTGTSVTFDTNNRIWFIGERFK